MKKGLSKIQKIIILSMLLCVIIMLSIVSIILVTGTDEHKTGTTRTIMIYMVGSNLESENGLATVELDSLLAVKDKVDLNNVNVLLYVGGTKKWHNFIDSNENALYKLTNNGFEKVESYKIKNLGDSRTLSDFLNYSYNNYKADSYDLFFWNHGAGVLGGMQDEISNDFLDIVEFKEALKDSPFNERNKLETAIFMTCLNGNLEMSNLFSKYSYYFVASEEISYSNALKGAMGFISNLSGSSYGNEVGNEYINDYKEAIKDLSSRSFATIDSTYSIIDETKVPTLMKKVDNFFSKVTVTGNYNDLAKVRSELHQYGEVEEGVSFYDTVDLYELVDKLKSYSPSEAESILKYIKEDVVIYNWSVNEHSNGLSIYFPFTGDSSSKGAHMRYYNKINMSSNYRKFISDFYKAQRATAYDFSIELSNNEIKYEDNKYKFKLNKTIKENYLKSSYIIMKKEGNKFISVYKDSDTYLDGDYLVTDANDQLIIAVDNNSGQKYAIDVLNSSNDNEYDKFLSHTTIYKDNKQYNSNLYLYSKELNKISGYDSYIIDTNSIGIESNIGTLVSLKDYNKIEFNSNVYTILDANGKYLDDWDENIESTKYTINGNNYHFERVNIPKNGDYYLMFVLKDVHNKDYYSNLIGIK